MYRDLNPLKPSKPSDYYDIDDEGNVVPPMQLDETEEEDYIYDDLEDEVRNAVERQVGQIAVNPGGNTEEMSPEERLERIREDRERDRSGTHPGTSRELTDDEKRAARKANEERRKAEKKQKKINDAIRKVMTINPTTRDASLAKELGNARIFLQKNGLNPDDYVPDYWKNN